MLRPYSWSFNQWIYTRRGSINNCVNSSFAQHFPSEIHKDYMKYQKITNLCYLACSQNETPTCHRQFQQYAAKRIQQADGLLGGQKWAVLEILDFRIVQIRWFLYKPYNFYNIYFLIRLIRVTFITWLVYVII